MYRLVTIVSILVCFLPVTILMVKRLWKDKLYFLIAGYWLLNGVMNIAELFNIRLDPRTDDYITLFANYADVPIVLFIFYLASSGMHQKVIKITLISFIAFEVVLTLINGFNFDTVTIILGASLIIIIAFSIAGIAAYLRRIEHTPKENVMVFVYSSFLFFYGAFIIVYVFNYLTSIGSDSDNFFIYYLELLLACLPAIYGLLRHADIKPGEAPRYRMDGF